MNSVELATICFLVILTATTILTVYVMFNSKLMLKEAFYSGNHHCYPYSSEHNALNSYKSKSKGWCTSGDYKPMPANDDFSTYNEGGIKCPNGYYKIPPLESLDTETKSWCKRSS